MTPESLTKIASEASHQGIPFYFAFLFIGLIIGVGVMWRTFLRQYEQLSTRLHTVEDETRAIATRSALALEQNATALRQNTDALTSLGRVIQEGHH